MIETAKYNIYLLNIIELNLTQLLAQYCTNIAQYCTNIISLTLINLLLINCY